MKKTNQLRCEDTILVSTGDQVLGSGALVTATTALNIANGQLFVASWDPNSTTRLGTAITPGTTASAVQAIRILRGTPKSAASETASPWENGDQAYQKTGIIRRNQIQAVAVKKFDFGQWGGQSVSGFPTLINDVEYGAFVNIDSTRIDKAFPLNSNTTYVAAPVKNFTVEAIVSPLDYVLQNIGSQLNSQSVLIQRNGSQGGVGNNNYVVLGIKLAPAAVTAPTVPTLVLTGGVVTAVTGGTGGSGYIVAPTVTTSGGTPTTVATITAQISAAGVVTGYTIVNGGAGYGVVPTAVLTGGTGLAIGTITPTTNVAVDTRNGVLQLVQFGLAGVSALADLVNQDPNITITSTVVPFNSINAGTFARVDALIVLGVPHALIPAYDDVPQTMVAARIELTPSFNTGVDPLKFTTFAKEIANTGRQWYNVWRNRPGLMVHTMQIQPMGDFFLEGLSYINLEKNYTSYMIEFWDNEVTLTTNEGYQKKATLLFPAELASSFTATVTNVVTRLAAGSVAYPIVTSNDAGTGTASAVTMAAIEATLTFWLESARTTGSNFRVTGDAIPGGAYLS